MLLAPWQQVMFNAAVAEIVRDLIGGTAIAIGNIEKVLHVPDLEIGKTLKFEAPRHESFPPKAFRI
jgi:hypothetical protein